MGPGAGTIKYRIPDAHSDFIFAVAGEEFGLVLCGVIALLFCMLTVRLLLRASRARDPFAQLAGAGLAMVIGLQAFINMGVAVSLLPAKGMTLPFISYGGSSLFAVALTMGFALAVTRQRPQLANARTSPTAHARRSPHRMKTIVLSAGGTGGHLFPAQALAEELVRRGHPHRGDDRRTRCEFTRAFPGASIETVPAATFADRTLGLRILAMIEIAIGILSARVKLARIKPAAVIGFGGYPSLAGDAGGLLRASSHRDPRTECGAWPRQPPCCQPHEGRRRRVSHRALCAQGCLQDRDDRQSGSSRSAGRSKTRLTIHLPPKAHCISWSSAAARALVR